MPKKANTTQSNKALLSLHENQYDYLAYSIVVTELKDTIAKFYWKNDAQIFMQEREQRMAKQRNKMVY